MTVELDLPKGWVRKDLKSIASRITKGSTPTTYGYSFQTAGINFIKVECIKEGKIQLKLIRDFISEDAHQSQSRSKLETNDILFSIAGTIGETCIIKDEDLPANTNQALAIIRGTNDSISPKLLRLQLHSFVNHIKAKARGGAMNNISLEDLKSFDIIIPPIPDQHHIVDKIEELFSELDKGIENLKTAQQQLKVYRQAVLKWAFEGKLTNENVKDGELPVGWEWTTFNDVCHKIGDIDHKMPKTTETGYPYVSTKDFTDDLKISFSNAKFISKEDYLALSRKIRPEKGDIIFPRYGTIGKNILVDFDMEFLVSYSCAVIKPKSKLINTNYLYLYSLSPHTTNEIRKYVVETTQANIGIASIKRFLLALAPLDEQQKVVDELESRLSVCDKMEETISASLQQAEALRQSILKRAFEGKLVKAETKVVNLDVLIKAEYEKDWQRKVLAGKIIEICYNDNNFGHTKFQKTLQVCEYHAQLEFNSHYIKDVAGPFDKDFFFPFIEEGRVNDWFIEKRKQVAIFFKPGSNIKNLVQGYNSYFKSVDDKIQFVINLLKDKTTFESELISTIYAIWNNYLINSLYISDNQLITEVYEWSESKIKFSERDIIFMWQWMKDVKLAPTGFGKLINN